MSKSSSLSSLSNLRRQPQQKRGQQRVEKILVAAAEIFAEAGFAAATIQQIADRANTAVGSIYQFFPDKLAIFHALSARHIQQAQILDAAFLAADIDRPLAQLASEFVDMWASYLEHPIPRCIILQYHLQAIPGLFPSIDNAILICTLPKANCSRKSVTIFVTACFCALFKVTKNIAKNCMPKLKMSSMAISIHTSAIIYYQCLIN
jgi:AcrR family transcriptional regulator